MVSLPDERGYFGDFGGRFVPETLMPALNELAQAYITLGVLELRQHHAPRARELFERALKVNPDSLEARYDLALSWIASGRRDEARREYRTLLLINPNLADPHHDLGILALEDHDLDGAVAELEKAVLLDPRRSVAWLNLGFAYTQAARYADAQRAFVSCLDTDPDNLACRRAVALVARAAAAQEPLLQDAVEAEGLHARGLRQLEKGAVEAAERSFRACAEADPACRYSLHQLLETQGEKSAAATECAAFLRAAARDLFTAEVDHCEREVSRLSP